PLLGPAEKDPVAAAQDLAGRQLDQSDRPVALLGGGREAPGRERHRLLAGADRKPLEAETAGIGESGDAGLGGRGHGCGGFALHEKICAWTPSTRTRSPPALRAWSAHSGETWPPAVSQALPAGKSPR